MLQQWFTSAKLGIFIHYGIYAVDGVPESWSIFNEQLSHDDYMAQLDGFTATNYDPRTWADLFARAGARYAVLTSKHHDGVALWDTAQSDLNVARRTPAGRDLIGPFCEALRERGLHVGLYFSHLDWSHPDYALLPVGQRTKSADMRWQDYPPEGEGWQRFLAFQRAQLKELCERYQPELLWFDGDWTPGDDAYWRFGELRELLQQWRPGVVTNNRMLHQGDYLTPEQGVPIVPPEGPWEFCVTINDSWGYQGRDRNWKSSRQIIRLFAETIGMGGNMLLDVGPMADGTIPPEQAERLEALGSWIGRHAEAIYPTGAGLPAGHHYGPSTLSNDGATLYAFAFDRPRELAIKGIRNAIRHVTALGTGQELSFQVNGGAPWMNVPGVLWIDVPEGALDADATVIKIELEGPLDLYRGAGQAISAN